MHPSIHDDDLCGHDDPVLYCAPYYVSQAGGVFRAQLSNDGGDGCHVRPSGGGGDGVPVGLDHDADHRDRLSVFLLESLQAVYHLSFHVHRCTHIDVLWSRDGVVSRDDVRPG